MKKKIIAIAMLATVALSSFAALAGCSGKQEETNVDKTSSVVEENNIVVNSSVPEQKQLTANDIVSQMKDNGANIGKIIVYDEETDVNNLLGRPNQYTSKVNFEDTTCEQYDVDNDPIGGTVEVFNTPEDAKSRYDYCSAFTQSSPMFAQYMYLYDTFLLRIDNAVTPSNAEKYEKAFHAIVKQENN